MKKNLVYSSIVLLSIGVFCSISNAASLSRQTADSAFFPEHIIGRVMDDNGQILQEYPSDFIYENGVLTEYVFPFIDLESTYEFYDYPRKASLITTNYDGHQPPLVEDLRFIYQDEKISHFEQLWSDEYVDRFTDYYYNDNGRLIQQDNRVSYGCYLRYLFDFDSNGNYIETHYTSNDFVNFWISSKSITVYNAQNLVSEVRTVRYNNAGDTLSAELKTYTIVDRKTDTIYTQILVDGEWVNSTVEHYIYDEPGRVVEYQTGVWSEETSEWDMDHAVVYDFNDNEHILTVSFRKKTDGEWGWDYFSDQKLFYDSYLHEWQRTFRHYGSMPDVRINQLEIDMRYDVCLMEEQSSEGVVSVYPNPVMNQLTITSPVEQTRVMVYDLTGRLVEARHFDFKTDINTEDWTPSIYVYEIWKDARRLHSGKIVKE